MCGEIEVEQSYHDAYRDKSKYFCCSDFIMYCLVQIHAYVTQVVRIMAESSGRALASQIIHCFTGFFLEAR